MKTGAPVSIRHSAQVRGRKPGELFLFSSKEFRRIWLHCLRKYGKMLCV
ncbi:hypothetical protein HMPREF1546_01315 [Oscillibacter sp. KLE 1745]|nr:hypothetical protein HMPREF1546_01315 [Oscillibacter sp. KLE 1745]